MAINAKLTAIIIMFFLAVTVSTAVGEIEGLPPGTEDTLYDLQATMYPPEIHGVTLDPETPKAGVPTTVTAKIFNDPNITDDETLEAWLIYSLDDGETWEYVDMDPSKDMRTWTGTIPGFDAGVEVLYGFRATDSSDNLYTEIPCLVTSWPPKGDTCMFDLAPDEDPLDDESQVTPDDFDIMNFKAGVDEEYLYVEMEVQGKIEPGSISPVYVHLYGFVMHNPDIGNPSDILTTGFIGIYAPHGEALTYYKCMTLSYPMDEVLIDNSQMTCLAEGSKLWFKVKDSAIGNNPSGIIKLLAANGVVTSITPLAGEPYDYSRVSTLALLDRWFIVED